MDWVPAGSQLQGVSPHLNSLGREGGHVHPYMEDLRLKASCENNIHDQLINQSIDQISIAPISPAKPGSVAQQPNQCSIVKSMKQSVASTVYRVSRCLKGKSQVKEMSLQMLQHESTESRCVYRKHNTIVTRGKTECLRLRHYLLRCTWSLRQSKVQALGCKFHRHTI